jgi:hypothetical protein
MKIPARELASGTCEIAFDIPDPASPAKLGLSDDRRELGLGVARVIFSA